MNATDKNRLLALTLERRLGGRVTDADAAILRRASMTLTRWAELECGDSNDYAAWAIERDENGEGPPYMVQQVYRRDGSGGVTVTRTRIPDREAGALRRVAELCKARGWYFFHQTDPRGAPLYISTEPLTDANYTNGVAV